MSAPMPHELWEQARSEHPNDDEERRRRYLTLMAEHGHLTLTVPEVERIDLSDPLPWINRARHRCWR